MASTVPVDSARRDEILERAYQYVLTHGLLDVSLRPLAAAVGSSPRVLLFLFGSKDDLLRALLARARAEELVLLAGLRQRGDVGLRATASAVWGWLTATEHRGLLRLWLESYARSLIDPDGPWAGFARGTVDDWLALLAESQPRPDACASTERTLVLAVLRGALLDLLATGEVERVTAAVQSFLQGC
jgi:AcrR family transcriptional regulator